MAQRRRIDLQAILENVLGSDHVYFQPPETVKMKYPCIVYARSDSAINHADNLKYSKYKRYSVTVIDYDPDSAIPDRVEDLPFCSFGRFYPKDNLNHWSFELYY